MKEILSHILYLQMDEILRQIPSDRRTYLYSATMTKKVAKLQRASLKDPVKVSVSSKYQTVETLMQYYLFIPLKYKVRMDMGWMGTLSQLSVVKDGYIITWWLISKLEELVKWQAIREQLGFIQTNIFYLPRPGSVSRSFAEWNVGEFDDGILFHLRRYSNDGAFVAESRLFGHSSPWANAAKQKISRS